MLSMHETNRSLPQLCPVLLCFTLSGFPLDFSKPCQALLCPALQVSLCPGCFVRHCFDQLCNTLACFAACCSRSCPALPISGYIAAHWTAFSWCHHHLCIALSVQLSITTGQHAATEARALGVHLFEVDVIMWPLLLAMPLLAMLLHCLLLLCRQAQCWPLLQGVMVLKQIHMHDRLLYVSTAGREQILSNHKGGQCKDQSIVRMERQLSVQRMERDLKTTSRNAVLMGWMCVVSRLAANTLARNGTTLHLGQTQIHVELLLACPGVACDMLMTFILVLLWRTQLRRLIMG